MQRTQGLASVAASQTLSEWRLGNECVKQMRAAGLKVLKPECFEVIQRAFQSQAETLLRRAMAVARHRQDNARCATTGGGRALVDRKGEGEGAVGGARGQVPEGMRLRLLAVTPQLLEDMHGVACSNAWHTASSSPPMKPTHTPPPTQAPARRVGHARPAARCAGPRARRARGGRGEAGRGA